MEEIRQCALAELESGGRRRPCCDTISRNAIGEIQRKAKERPYSSLFYELAFYFREDHCLAAAYHIWQPVIRRWIVRFEFKLREDRFDDLIDDIFFETFDALFKTAIQNRMEGFEAGRIHNFLRSTVRRRLFARCQGEKRAMINKLKKRLELLEPEDMEFLRSEILPGYGARRSELETKIFLLYVLERKPVVELLKDENVKLLTEAFNNPVKALHNRIPTVLWNIYKLLRRREGASESSFCKELLHSWTGGAGPPSLMNL